jgi:basic membrane protein A
MFKKKYLTLVIIALFVLVLAGCQPASESAAELPSADAEVEDPVRVLFMTEDPVGINPYFISGLDGLAKAEADFNIETTIVEGTGDPAQNDENLRAVVREDYDLIILMTFGFTDILTEVAPEYPDLPIVCIDCAVEVESVLNVDFNSHEAAFLNGAAAGLLTESNVIGQIGAVDIPFLHRWIDPYAVGAQYVNPDVTMLEPLWVGDWADPATAKELAITLSNQGADIINGVAAGGNAGIFEAAQELGFLSHGVDINECPAAPGSIIDNTLKRVDLAVYDSIASFLSGDPIGGWAAYGLADGGVDLASFAWPDDDTQCVLAENPDVMAEVAELRQMIIDGTIVIPDPLWGGDYILP